jgi:hypothetical protein
VLTHGHSELAMLRKMIVVQREVYVFSFSESQIVWL